MKKFITAIVVPNEWEKQQVIEAVNRGILSTIQADPTKYRDTKLTGLNWAAYMLDESELKRQDV